MGLNFFHNYYTVFDPQLQRVGFTENALSPLAMELIQVSTSNNGVALNMEIIPQQGRNSKVVIVVLLITAILCLPLLIVWRTRKQHFAYSELTEPLLS